MAASGGAIRAGKAYVEFYADKSKFVRALRSMESDLKSFGSSMLRIGAGMASVGVAAAAALAPVLAAGTKLQDMFAKTAKRTGASTEALSVLKYAAESSGASLDDVTSAMGNVNAKLVDVAQGSMEAGAGFAKLGMNLADLMRMSPENRFVAIADRLSKIQNPALRAAAATEVFGGSAEALLPMIAGGTKGLAAMAKRAQELGGVMSGDAASAGERLSTAFYDIQTAVGGVVSEVTAALAPTLISVAETITPIITAIGTWVSENQELVVTAAKVVAGIAAVGVVIATAGAAFLGIATVVGTVSAAFAGVIAAVTALASPVGLVVAGMAGLTTAAGLALAAWLKFTDSGQAAFAWFKEQFLAFAGKIKEAWSGIVAAVSKGDFETAWRVAVDGVMLVWAELKDYLLTKWEQTTIGILTGADFAFTELKKIVINAFAALTKVMMDFQLGMGDLWDEITIQAAQAAKKMSGPLKAIATAMALATGKDPRIVNQQLSDQGLDKIAAEAKTRISARKTFGNMGKGAVDVARNALTKEANQGFTDRTMERVDKFAANKKGRTNDIEEAAFQFAMSVKRAKATDSKKAENPMKVATGGGPGGGLNLQTFDFSGAKQMEAKSVTSGTFSASAAARLGGTGSPMEDLARQQLAQLRKIAGGVSDFGRLG